jgi:hypothetical protein
MIFVVGLRLLGRRAGRRRRATRITRDGLTIGIARAGDAGYVREQRQAQPQPVKALNAADALHQPGVDHRGEGQEQKTQARHNRRAERRILRHRPRDPEDQQHHPREKSRERRQATTCIRTHFNAPFCEARFFCETAC